MIGFSKLDSLLIGFPKLDSFCFINLLALDYLPGDNLFVDLICFIEFLSFEGDIYFAEFVLFTGDFIFETDFVSLLGLVSLIRTWSKDYLLSLFLLVGLRAFNFLGGEYSLVFFY